MEKYCEILIGVKIIVVNGLMGVFEREEFVVGMVGVFRVIGESFVFLVVGGGYLIVRDRKSVV